MKPGHFVALSLVVWYLMMPPPLSSLAKDGSIKPVQSWPFIGVFRTEKDCDAERRTFSKLDPNLGSYRGLPPEEIYDVECIASDDPRLKEK
ncbi:MAG: hypothetical protein ACLQAT_26325 [Candidatus Binataceae bacterium]